MKGIMDIHSHILYKVDDGAESIEKSMQILEREYEQGVTDVILTPHFHMGECMPDQLQIREHYDRLRVKIKTKIPDMKIYLGNEIMACNDMVEMLDKGEVLTLAGSRYVLVEFYPSAQYSIIEKSLNNLLNGGYVPVVAHCERYKCLRQAIKVIHYERVKHLTEMGAYMQVNVTSVYGRDKRFVAKLIDHDLLHFVASDAHSLGVRGVYWKQCEEYLKEKYKKKYIHWLLIENPKKILSGEYI